MKQDRELPRRVQVRSSQYLNNLIEQDHRRVKQRTRPMLGFKRFDNAVVTLSGIELAEKIKKGRFKLGKLGGAKASMSELWNAALAA
jgi:transposase-like protein